MNGSIKKRISFLLVVLMCLCLGTALSDGIELPHGLLRVGDEAFYGDTAIQEVTVPEGTLYIGDRAFYGSGLKKIHLPDSILQIGSNAMDKDVVGYGPADNAYLKNYFLSRGMVYNDGTGDISKLGDFEFRSIDETRSEVAAYHGDDLNVIIPHTDGTGRRVTRIGDEAFLDNYTVVSVTMYDTITEIGRGAFARCYGMTSISLSPNISFIDPYAFSGDTGLLIYGYYGTYAHEFAKENQISFAAYDAPESETLEAEISAPAPTQIRLLLNRVKGATEYRIYHSLYSYQSSVKTPIVQKQNPDSEQIVPILLSNLQPGKMYYVWVSAVVDGVEQAPVALSIKTPTGGSPGTPQRVYTICWTTDSVRIGWYPGYGADYYLVLYRKTGESQWNVFGTAVRAQQVVSAETLPKFTVTGLEENVSYDFAVQAYNRFKQASNISTKVTQATFEHRTAYLHTPELLTYPDSETTEENGYVDNSSPVTLLGESSGRYYFEMQRSAGDTAYRWASKTYIKDYPFPSWVGYLNVESAPTYAKADSTYKNGLVTNRSDLKVIGIEGTRYYIEVTMANGGKYKTWVDQSVVVRPQTLSAPALTNPGAEGALVDRDNPVISWNAVTGASCYYVTLVNRDTGKVIIKNRDVGLDTSCELTEKELQGVHYIVKVAAGQEFVPADSEALKWAECSFTTAAVDFSWELLDTKALDTGTVDVVVWAPDDVKSVYISGTHQELGYGTPEYSLLEARAATREADGTFVIHVKNETKGASAAWLDTLHYCNADKEDMLAEPIQQMIHFIPKTIDLVRVFNYRSSASIYKNGTDSHGNSTVDVLQEGLPVHVWMETDRVSYISYKKQDGKTCEGFVFSRIHDHTNASYYDKDLKEHTYCTLCQPRTQAQLQEDAENYAAYLENRASTTGASLFSLYDTAGLYLGKIREINENLATQIGAYIYFAGTISVGDIGAKIVEGSNNVDSIKEKSVLKALELILQANPYSLKNAGEVESLLNLEMDIGSQVTEGIKLLGGSDVPEAARETWNNAIQGIRNGLKNPDGLKDVISTLTSNSGSLGSVLGQEFLNQFIIRTKSLSDNIEIRKQQIGQNVENGIGYALGVLSWIIDSGVDIAEYNMTNAERKQLVAYAFTARDENLKLLKMIRQAYSDKFIQEQCDSIIADLLSADSAKQVIEAVNSVDADDVKAWLAIMAKNGFVNIGKLAGSAAGSALLKCFLGKAGGLVTLVPSIIGMVVEAVTHTGQGYNAFEDADILHTDMEQFIQQFSGVVNSSSTGSEVRAFGQIYIAELKIAGLEVCKDIVDSSSALQQLDSWASDLNNKASDLVLTLSKIN